MSPERAPGRLNPWPAAIIGSFVVFVIIQVVIIVISTTHFEPPPDAQYYKHGLEYDRQIQAQALQRAEGWTFQVPLPHRFEAGRSVRLSLQVRDAAGRVLEGGALRVLIARPATARDDRAMPLREVSPGRYEGDLALSAGVWDLTFEAVQGRRVMTERRRVVVETARP